MDNEPENRKRVDGRMQLSFCSSPNSGSPTCLQGFSKAACKVAQEDGCIGKGEVKSQTVSCEAVNCLAGLWLHHTSSDLRMH